MSIHSVFTKLRRTATLQSLRQLVLLIPLLACGSVVLAVQEKKISSISAGAAKIDITPGFPIRLSGYGGRTTESEGVEQPLWAKALAFGTTPGDTAVLVTVDNVGVPATITEEVYKRVSARHPFPRSNFTISSSHTHNAPMLTGILPWMFGKDLEPGQQATVAKYTALLTDQLEKVVLQSLQDRQPALLTHAEGQAGFAKNRRTPGGPVDHSLPVLAVRRLDGSLRALLANYACHCTTLASNLVGGDWAGYAQEFMERDHPGSIAMISIGCGADANPHPLGSQQAAKDHGQEIATEVSRLLTGPMESLTETPTGALRRFDLPFDTLPDRAHWEATAPQQGINGFHARKNLERLNRGETLPTSLPYSVQTWNFGDAMAMVFLPGEVVVDYALGLKKQYRKLWVTAYANDVPCYIPSTRILKEGGYEGASAMPYYDRPTRLGPETENLIFAEIRQILPESLRLPGLPGTPAPLAPVDALKQIQTRPGFSVELVAAEPEVVDPVAIDFAADGRLWVVEMLDYPLGMDGKGKAGGRVKFLEDSNGDGRFEKATVFLDGLPFPTGVMAWRKGALVAAAPDILYAEDSDGDGRAERVTKLFSGFATDNFQARVNGLSRGLDGWIYGANGLLGGIIRSSQTGKSVELGGRDFRMNPDTGAFETVSGLTQQGRVRDDQDRWFGSDNSTFAWQYPMPERYLRRNSEVAPPEQRLRVEKSPRVFPTSRTLERFNDPSHANSATGACGGDFYRDTLLGEDFYGDYFVNETVHNLTTRLKLTPDGIRFIGGRAEGEESSEFFSSSDNWSRPVQVRTGPDGALWIVDMYRFVIEHPRWIAAEQLAKLDVRAGADKGRIYRVFPKEKSPRPIRNLTTLPIPELVAAFDTPNGPVRDLIQEQIVQRTLTDAVPAIAAFATSNPWAPTRLQALAVLDGLGALPPSLLLQAMKDKDPGVRSMALRLCETKFRDHPELGAAATSLAQDPDAGVRYQLALSLGEWDHPTAGQTLGRLAVQDMSDVWMRTAILSSSLPQAAEVLPAVLSAPVDSKGRSELIGGLISTVVASGNQEAISKVLGGLADTGADQAEAWRFSAWANLMQAMERRNLQWNDLAAAKGSTGVSLAGRLAPVFRKAGTIAFDEKAAPDLRLAALQCFGFDPDMDRSGVERLVTLFETSPQVDLRESSLQALRRSPNPALPAVVLQDWTRRSPAARSTWITLLLSRGTWMEELLTAMEKNVIGVSEIAPTQRDRFLKSERTQVRERAEKLFVSLAPQGRLEVLAAFRDTAKLVGDSQRGAGVFLSNCSICHVARGVGNAVGPDISLFRDKGVPEYLEAILHPNAVVEPRFLNYVAELKNGTFAAGIITNETANSLTLSQAAGIRQVVMRPDIKELKPSPVSMMPEGFEQSIGPAQMADLIAYLKESGPRDFGSSTPVSAAAARASFGPSQANGLAKITAASLLFDYTSWLGELPFAHCHQSDGTSHVRWESAPFPENPKPDEKPVLRFAGGMGHLSQPAGSFALKVNGKAALEFGVELQDHQWTNPDGTVKLTYEARESGPQDSNGIFTVHLDPSLITPGKPIVFEVTGSAAKSQRWFGVYALNPGMVALPDPGSEQPLASQLLDPATPDATRQSIIKAHPDQSGAFLRELIAHLVPGTPEEYRRIPVIWSVSIAAAKRDDAATIRDLLEISLPSLHAPLHDWQAVVIGGGLINGLGMITPWPAQRLKEIIGTDSALNARWEHSLRLAALMADNASVPPGTRYDALRMVPFLPWETAGPILTRYAARDQHPELQQGAVCGLADLHLPQAADALLGAFRGLTGDNKQFAIEGLLRNRERRDLLLRAIEDHRITTVDLGEAGVSKLQKHQDPGFRSRILPLLQP